jgi:hypothetical protein
LLNQQHIVVRLKVEAVEWSVSNPAINPYEVFSVTADVSGACK